MELNNKLRLVANIDLLEETETLKKELASVIELPKDKEKQPDLQYFSAVFVSSGTNLNKAHFLPSELVLAAKSVPSKAVDVEHEEAEIIGHIFDYAFIDVEGNKLNVSELASMEQASLDTKDMHIVIAGVIYKSRFPNLSKEVAAGLWKVSMEAYYQDYDLKIGTMVLDKREAELLGYDAASENFIGRYAKVFKKGVEIASGEVARVLRGICFSGVGIVKNPANPPSVILETAKVKEPSSAASSFEASDLMLNYDTIVEKASNNVTYQNIDTFVENKADKSDKADKADKADKVGDADIENSSSANEDSVGICVNYKKRQTVDAIEGPDTKVEHENWCTLYDQGCTSFSRDTSDPECLRNQTKFIVMSCIEAVTKSKSLDKTSKALLEALENKITKASSLL